MIKVECSLTQRQYREFMKYHVLGRKSDVIRHAILCLLFAAFGAVNFLAGSPILGWIFVLLGVYLFMSRYIRFYSSVNRIVSEYGLTDEPKYFYSLVLREADFEVRNRKEKAVYPWDRVHLACIRKNERIIYLYLNPSNAFLIPEEGIEGTDLEGAAAFLEQRLPENKVLYIETGGK